VIPHSKPFITAEDEVAVVGVLGSGMVAQGELAARFARALADYLRVPDGVLTSSGTAAITLVLRALEFPAASEVIIPTYVCRSVGDAVTEAGLAPVLCDVGDQWNMTPESVEPMMSERTVAIIVPHVFGIVQDVDAFARFDVPVIEDACQSFGVLDGRPIGTRGAAGVFSFNATKCLTTGEGGFVSTNDPALARRIRELADGHRGELKRFFSPMTDLQASLGLSQLARYDDFLARRHCLADRYLASLCELPVSLPSAVRHRSMFFRFPVLASGGSFEHALEEFRRRGVAVRRGVDALLHRTIGLPPTSFPVAERLFRETVSLPLYPAMTDDEQDLVIQACREVWATS
jgi:UDP-4-amino-4-deoxy-L-arabinose-oxoglutarate aminotransferase